ncbi:MAG: hypothetical protein WCK28_23665, partial [Burkholderiales bacterium]
RPRDTGIPARIRDAAGRNPAAGDPDEAPEVRAPRVDAPVERRAPERHLLSVLSDLDLADFPADPQRLRMDADIALGQLDRDVWLELVGRDGTVQEVKVAWINTRRTVVLLVRRPDRRAMSLRIDELRERFAQRRAAIIR